MHFLTVCREVLLFLRSAASGPTMHEGKEKRAARIMADRRVDVMATFIAAQALPPHRTYAGPDCNSFLAACIVECTDQGCGGHRHFCLEWDFKHHFESKGLAVFHDRRVFLHGHFSTSCETRYRAPVSVKLPGEKSLLTLDTAGSLCCTTGGCKLPGWQGQIKGTKNKPVHPVHLQHK